MKFYRKSPNLLIKIDYIKSEVIIEFTGKILGSRYPELISLNNIGQCFQNIEKLGFCKFEVNLNSKEQIRQALGIGSNSLKDVLSSTENPIADFLEESVKHKTEDSLCSDWKSYQRRLVLQDCDFDLGKVEVKTGEMKRSAQCTE